MATSTRRCLAAAAGCAAVLSGCASLEEDDVREVATAFEDPPTAPADRCALLAPATLAALEAEEPCNEAIAAVRLPGGDVESVEIWGGNAQVRLSGDTLFLTETSAGWRVVAASCQPRGEAPYDCEVEGS